MYRIGCVLHVNSNKNVILKSENLPRIGDKVVDEQLKPVGTVFDILGPTSAPYVSVKPDTEDPHRLINHVLYAIPSRMRKRRR